MLYYTPQLSEFYFGFEFEVLNTKGKMFIPSYDEGVWFITKVDTGVLGDLSNIQKLILEKQIRVKHLTYEDIKNEGFEMYLNNITKYRSINNFCTQITYFINYKSLHIKDGLNSVYDGTCKNINEFRNIMKSVTIKCIAENAVK